MLSCDIYPSRHQAASSRAAGGCLLLAGGGASAGAGATLHPAQTQLDSGELTAGGERDLNAGRVHSHSLTLPCTKLDISRYKCR